MRESIEECTGEKGIAYEDDNDWCYGWMKLPLNHPNCTRMKGYIYIRFDSVFKYLGMYSQVPNKRVYSFIQNS